MNNNNRNNNNNNRRRGRGNNRGQGGGNPMGQNRIDSRARGNAPQMLDKYKKLAHDATMNDDRVQTEYYLQFADHYFRVIADAQAQKDEQRSKREAERGPDSDDGSDGDGDGEDNRRAFARDRQDRDDDRNPRGRKPRRSRDDDERSSDDADGPREGREGEEAAGNPFSPEPKPRRARKPVSNGLESALPPAIGNDDDAPAAKPRVRRTRRPRDEDGESSVEAVG